MRRVKDENPESKLSWTDLKGDAVWFVQSESCCGILNGILSNLIKNLAIFDNMDGPRGYYAKWKKSVNERQIPCDFSHMWNLKTQSKMSKHKTEADS